jgi:hypothetical protein
VSKLDVVKEEIGYLKLWLGIAVVTDISLFSSLITNIGHGLTILAAAGSIAVVAITSFAFFIHRRIAKRIEELEDQ